MNRLMELLADRPVLYLATVEGYYPRVRPMNHYMVYKNRLYLAMNREKEAYKQLLDNTNLELCTALDENRFLRIQGTVDFDRDPASYEAVYQALPDLKDAYPADSNKHLALVYLDQISAIVFDRQDNTKTIAHT